MISPKPYDSGKGFIALTQTSTDLKVMVLLIDVMGKGRIEKVIYTSIPEYLHLSERIQVKDYKSLSIYPWAKKRMSEMCTKESSYAENVFIEKCGAFRESLLRQVFFKVNGRYYFLDFFFPNNNLAIEIDGSYHKGEDVAKRDKIRDADFHSIGITTIRFSTSQLFDKDFKEKYYLPSLVYAKRRRIERVSATSHQIQLKKAIDELLACEKNMAVEFRCKSTAFLRAISHESAPFKKAADMALLCKFYDIKREKNLVILPRFVGTMKQTRKKEKQWINGLEAACLACRADKVVEI